MPPDLATPRALFLDFGGVLSEVHRRDVGLGETAHAVSALLERCKVDLDPDRVVSDVRAGDRAFRQWKASQSRAAEPLEPSHHRFWDRFVTADWPRAARAAVSAHAAELCEIFEAATVFRPPRAGALELLEHVHEAGLRTALICNTLSANGTRRLLREYGFAGLLSVELYSDEQGIRKPNPQIFALALEALDVNAEEVWYVGDKFDRDVLAARRADLGAAILMTAKPLDDAITPGLVPDAVVADPPALLELIRIYLTDQR